ncbi:MAG TPA: right-handed parallel beta-helix repeat-containing protein [Limnochordia bacterium]|nr:right-handed parallel beta-helix repeat-containing protein [Limnochordia bacterium]
MDVAPLSLYVAPTGSDRWSGRLSTADGADGPLATLAGARDRVRSLKQSARLRGPVVVYLRSGRYPVHEPIVFGPDDSAPVTYTAYPGERAVLDGGERLSGWREMRLGEQRAWQAELPNWARAVRSLWVNGRRCARPRWPKRGYLQIEDVPGRTREAPLFAGAETFVYAPGDLRPWRNLTDAEIVVPHYWTSERMPIAELDEATRTVRSTRRSVFSLTDDFTRRWADYYVENVYEALAPGEWYADRAEGVLTYLPLPDETLEQAELVVPRAQTFVRLAGRPEAGRFVEQLRFVGLSFAHGDWRQPPGGGEGFGDEVAPLDLASAPQAAANLGGALELRGARYCAIEECTIEHIGLYGVDLGEGCTANRIVGNEIADMGAGGVKLNGAAADAPVALRTGGNRITDNHIHHGGRVFHAAVGVIAQHACGNAISYNHIHDLYYSGISCGWVWGYAESVSKENRIEYNHIHHLGDGATLNDMGCIYTLGVQPGTVIRGNVCHDVNAKNYGGWGIYLDEGSAHILVEGNLSYNTSQQPFHQHYGRENLVRRNLFALGRQSQIALGRAEGHNAFTLTQNVILTDGAPLYTSGDAGSLQTPAFQSDLNLLWDLSGGALTGRSGRETYDLAALQAHGLDRHSVVADPGCADVAAGDFTLRADSPAYALGFTPIDPAAAGPRPPEARD